MLRPEQALQQTVVKHLEARVSPGVVWFSVPLNKHGTGRKFHIQGAIAKSMGARKGVSDLIFLHRGQAFALELKAAKGRTTKEQDDFLMDWSNAGGICFAAEGLDKALAILECWGLLVGTAN